MELAEELELRLLRCVAEHEAQHPALPVKDTELALALGIDYSQTHSLLSGLEALGQIEAKSFHTIGLGIWRASGPRKRTRLTGTAARQGRVVVMRSLHAERGPRGGAASPGRTAGHAGSG